MDSESFVWYQESFVWGNYYDFRLPRSIPELKNFDMGFEGASIVSSVELWIVFYIVAYSIVLSVESLLRLAVSVYSYPVHYVANL